MVSEASVPNTSLMVVSFRLRADLRDAFAAPVHKLPIGHRPRMAGDE